MSGKEQQKEPMHGEPPDEKLLNGPVDADRSCTDIIFLVIYILAFIAMIVVSITGFAEGHPDRLAVPYDPNGRACGIDSEVQAYPYIYFGVPWIGYLNRTACVSSCPESDINGNFPSLLKCVPNKLLPDCEQHLPTSTATIQSVATEGTSAFGNALNSSVFFYNTTGVFGRVCFPGASLTQYLNFSSAVNMDKLEKYASDVKNSWTIILASAGIAFVIGFIYMVIMRYCSGVFTWLGIVLYFAALAAFDYYLYNRWQNYDPNTDSQSLQSIQVGFWVVLGICVASVIVFICQFNNIRLAIAIIKSAALFIADVPCVFAIPPIFILITCAFWAYWIAAFLYIYSMGTITGSSTTPFATVEWSQNTKYMLVYFLFMGLWNNALISAVNSFIISCSCSNWYFQQGTGQFLSFPMCKAFSRTILHFGSLAFGSFILAIVQFIRFWLEYMAYQIKNAGGDQNQCMKYLIDCMRCYVACFERFISFLNENAYIQIGLTGKSFCPAAKDAFYLIFSNPGKFSIVDGIGGIFCRIGEVLICAITSYICYMIITQNSPWNTELYSPLLPTLFFIIVSWMIGSLFMHVYGMAIDTILQCSIVDETLSLKKGQPPKFCPEPLRDFFKDMEGNSSKYKK